MHIIDKDWFAAHLIGQSLVVKFKIDNNNNAVVLANIGTHKEVYGSTRRFK